MYKFYCLTSITKVARWILYSWHIADCTASDSTLSWSIYCSCWLFFHFRSSVSFYVTRFTSGSCAMTHLWNPGKSMNDAVRARLVGTIMPVFHKGVDWILNDLAGFACRTNNGTISMIHPVVTMMAIVIASDAVKFYFPNGVGSLGGVHEVWIVWICCS